MKIFKNKRHNLMLKIIVVVVIFAAITIFSVTFLSKRKCESKVSSQDVSEKGSVKTTLNNLDTKSIIESRHQIGKKSEDPIERKKTDPKKPTVFNEDISKIKSADGVFEISVEKLNVLPPNKDELPQVDIVGGIEIHLDKPKKTNNKNQTTEITK